MLMFFLIIASILFFFGLACVLTGSVQKRNEARRVRDGGESSSNNNELPVGFIAKLAGSACLVIALIIFGWNSFYTQGVGESRVLVNVTGSVAGSSTSPGFSFKLPWVSTESFNTRNIVIDYRNPDPNGGKLTEEQQAALAGTAIGANDADGALAQVDITVNLSLEPSHVEDVFKKYQSQENFHERVIKNDVRSVVRSTVVKYSTANLRPQRDEVATKIAKELENAWASQGLIVESVRLHNIAYSGDIEASLVAVQTARNEADKAQANLETAKIAAEKTRVDALAQADADQITRCGAEVIIEQAMINGKEVDVVKTIPLQGDDCQNRLNMQVLMSRYIDALRVFGENGQVIITDGNSMPLVNLQKSLKEME